MQPPDHERLARSLLPAVLEAGAIQMHYFRVGVPVETKRDASPVTAADRESEAVLLAAIAAVAPDLPVVAEEAVERGRIPEVESAFFLVDPLDGTREFVSGRREFTVNVALIHDGEPVFGIVYAPAMPELYVTLAGRRAVFSELPLENSPADLADYRFTDIRTRPADPSALVAVASRSHLTPETEAFLERYRVVERRSAGSSLKFGLLARGQADVYPRLGPTMQWDTAAGHAILAAAGGTVTTVDGSPLRYGRHDGSFRNPHFVAWGQSHPMPQCD